MSSKIKGLRRVGIVGLSTVVAASMMTLSGVSAFAVAGDYTLVGTATSVIQGGTSQAAAGVSLDFANNFAAADQQTFTIARGATANSCTDAAGVAAAVDFSSAPTATLTGPFDVLGVLAGDATSTKPAFTVALTGSTPQCTANGVLDTFTVTMTGASAGFVIDDFFTLALSGVNYNVGATAAAGAVNLITTGDLATPTTATLVNATVTVGSYTVIPLIAAQSNSDGNTLGTASFVETTAGAFFDTATNVTLTLTGGGTFTADVTPTIALPSGYTATTVGSTTVAPPATTSATTYEFQVNGPATLVKATVSVSGLKLDAPAGPVVVGLTENVSPGGSTMDAANVLDFAARTGGSDRYATAAALFTSANNADVFAQGGSDSAASVVLSSGFDFPDALSANYLAGRLNTGTLLTKPNTLSPAARTAILGSGVSTVYITGETGAVSQAVENQVSALHVSNSPTEAFITVIRLGGANRFVTNQIINENNFTTSNTVLLASGQDFPDALALGPIAVNRHFPLILTRGVTLGANENAQLADFSPTNVIIAGGIGVVSAGIETSLKAQGFNVVRLAGDNRTQTAAAVATWATVGIANAAGVTPTTGINAAQGFSSSRTYIARGDDFADALAAGPVAGADVEDPSVIVLTSTKTVLGLGIPDYLGTKTLGVATATDVDVLHALGLTGAVTNPMMRAAAVTIGQ